MSVLPELTPAQIEMMKKVLGNFNYKNDLGPSKRSIKKKYFFVIVICLVVLTTGAIGFWEWRANDLQVGSVGEKNTTEERKSFLSKLLPDDNTTSVNEMDGKNLKREQTGQSLVNGVYSTILGDSWSLGFGANGKIFGGKASNNKNVDVDKFVNDEEAVNSKYELVAIDGNAKELATAPVWTNSENPYESNGNWTSLLYLPIGTNSVGLKERGSDKYLDQVYVVTEMSKIEIEKIANTDWRSNLNVHATLNGESEGIFLMITLQNEDFRQQKFYFPEPKISDNVIIAAVDLNSLDIKSSAKWKIIVQAASMFTIKSFSSDQFIIIK